MSATDAVTEALADIEYRHDPENSWPEWLLAYAQEDVPLLLGAVRAVLANADPDLALISPDAAWIGGYRDAMRDVRGAIESALA